MFSQCHHFGISGGEFNHVQGDQHTYRHNTTNHVRGSHNTYKTINRGNHNVTNNGVNHGWDPSDNDDDDDDDDDFPPPPPHLQQSHRPRTSHAPSDPTVYGYNDSFVNPRHWEHYPAPPQSAPPVMTENVDDRHHMNGPSPFYGAYPPNQNHYPLDIPNPNPEEHPTAMVQNDNVTPTPPITAAPTPRRTVGGSQLGLQLSDTQSSPSPNPRTAQHANERNGLPFINAEGTYLNPDPHRQSTPIAMSSSLRGGESCEQPSPGRLPTLTSPPATSLRLSQASVHITPGVQNNVNAQNRRSPPTFSQPSASERRRPFPVPEEMRTQSTDADSIAVDEDQRDDSAQP